jgi:hypothetical protein
MDAYKSHLGLGIAGNFALHLQQAGEMEDFKDVITEDENGPKGMFPFYLPGFANQLGIFPLSSNTILLPEHKVNVQAEPEVALICELEYCEGAVAKIVPTHFAAYNDCSIRKEGAKKISEKKNWSKASKGLSKDLIAIDVFDKGGVMDRYRIASFLRREGTLHRYGEDVELSGYSYFYEKLLTWMVNQINTQKDFGPLEPLSEYVSTCKFPSRAVISIGATRYTEYGEHTFLQPGDEVIVVLYDETRFKADEIFERVAEGTVQVEGVSALIEKVL